MDYVMVPVPEEHVIDVMQHVARLVARASVVPWDDDAVVGLFEEVDEATRSVLSVVARSAVAGKELSDEDAAASVELSVRELRTIVRDLGDIALRDKREPILVLREMPVVLRNGRTVHKRMFTMTDAVARTIRAHERESVSAPPGTAPDDSE
jgi:hypothetical protein